MQLPEFQPAGHQPLNEGASSAVNGVTQRAMEEGNGTSAASDHANSIQRQQQPHAGFQIHRFSEAAMDEVVHFQITNLGRQVLVWVGTGSAPPALGHLAMGMPTQQTNSDPEGAGRGSFQGSAVSTLLLHGSGDDQASTLVQKLTKRFKTPMLIAWNVPASNPMLGAWAEQKLVQHLQAVLL